MIRDNLYTIKTLENNRHFLVHLNAEHPVFKGHFPSQPVLPGVCTLTMLRDAVSICENRPIRFQHIRECKFLSVVDPRVSDSLELHITATDGELKATVTNGEQTVLKLKASYILQDE